MFLHQPSHTKIEWPSLELEKLDEIIVVNANNSSNNNNTILHLSKCMSLLLTTYLAGKI